ncbi:serine/threonine protein kinase [Noviherbaspirillum aridicola]|uniref:Serine/threonine protein kinase n=1 Tax=Noviherbaspirillum aridicola TaxID=2849687 RepID=A0ABQ4Q8N7_9BURK|nr:serine/threonine protein kinase [Noviherbaspirillum aridicola]
MLDRVCVTTGSQLYRANSLADHAEVLVKLYGDSTLAPHPLREFETLKKLDLPGVAKPRTMAKQADRILMVLDPLEGTPLESVLGQERLQTSLALNMACQLAAVLGGLHAAHVVHRDFRPANLLVRENGTLVLLDVSLAVSDEPGTHADKNAPPCDWAYASPEQTGRMHRAVDHRTDFYSLGVMMYRMLTGQLPFRAADPLEWSHCHVARVPIPPHALCPDIPPALSGIVMKLLEKMPEDRYQSAKALLADLARCEKQWQTWARIPLFALGSGDASRRFQFPAGLYGRERETALLKDAYGSMKQKGNTSLLLVSGYSGAGKSTLMMQLRESVLQDGGIYLFGKCETHQQHVPFAPLASAFRELVQKILAESQARVAAWSESILHAVGGNGQLIIDIIPQLEHVIGPQHPPPALPPTEAHHRLLHVFRHFIGAFAGKSHPLVLCLDDLQWADAITLSLLESLLVEPEVDYLLLAGTYRSNEVGPLHALTVTLEAIRRAETRFLNIELAPLTSKDMGDLIADGLRCDDAELIRPLAALVHEKTAGNPFFAIQFIRALDDEGLLSFEPGTATWDWDIGGIRARGFTDNVVELLALRLGCLAAPTRTALNRLALLGSQASLRKLALACDQSEEDTQAALEEAIRLGLVSASGSTYTFHHDRFQEAAASLVPDEEHARIHLGIARRLFNGLPGAEQKDQVFDLVNQFNRALMLVESREERKRVALLNLEAGKRARRSTAYEAALAYFEHGAAILPAGSWARHYSLAFELALNRAECALITGKTDTLQSQLAVLSEKAARLSDRAAVTRLWVAFHTAHGRLDSAVQACLTYLGQLGIEWSARPSDAEVASEYALLREQMRNRRISDLVHLPLLADPDQQATMEVLTELLPMTMSTPNLAAATSLRMVNLSIRHGNCDGSCFAYVLMTTFMGPRFGDYRAGYEFGELSVDLVERRGLVLFKARVFLCYATLIIPWGRDMHDGFEWIRLAADAGRESGDFRFYSFCDSNLVTLQLATGEPLDKVQHEAERGVAFARSVRFDYNVLILQGQLAMIRRLRGLAPDFSAVTDEPFDAQDFEQLLEGNEQLVMPACWYWVRKLQACFLEHDYAAALHAAGIAGALLWCSQSFLESAEFHYYSALSHAGAWNGAGSEQRQQHLDAIHRHLKQLETWSQCCADNFENRRALVAAEAARIEGREFDAVRLYEQAIESARTNRLIHNEAIAHELAAAFYLDRGCTTAARAHWREAHHRFACWRADGKVRQLEARYAPLRIIPDQSEATPLEGTAVQFDAMTVAKAAQAISGEIVLHELVDTLLRIMMEHAGAQKGYLLLSKKQTLHLAAEANVDLATVRVHVYDDMRDATALLPVGVLNYVMHSHEPLLLTDTGVPSPFSSDPYFSTRRPKSALCLPILRRNLLIGLLYLENEDVSHAFIPESVTVLKLLASQAAISLENARLYDDLLAERAKTRRLADANIIGVCFWDVATGITEANGALAQLLGYSRQQLCAMRWTDITPPEYRSTDDAAMTEVQETGVFAPYEKELLRRDGSRVPVLVGGAAFADSPRQGVAFVLDLSERKRAASALRRAYDELESRVRERTDELNRLIEQLQSEVAARRRAEEELEKLCAGPGRKPMSAADD